MHTNDVLYKIIKALDLDKKEIIEIYNILDYSMSEDQVDALLRKQQDKGFKVCSYEELGLFLDALVIHKRGPSDKKSSEDEIVELTNNLIIKKLRIALELKEAESEIIFNLGDVSLGKQEFKVLFRKESHKNFKTCPDELLIAFLDGLDEFYYKAEEV